MIVPFSGSGKSISWNFTRGSCTHPTKKAYLFEEKPFPEYYDTITKSRTARDSVTPASPFFSKRTPHGATMFAKTINAWGLIYLNEIRSWNSWSTSYDRLSTFDNLTLADLTTFHLKVMDALVLHK